MSRTYKDMKNHHNKAWENTHHLVNRTNNWTNTQENLKRVKINVHRALHTVFGNEDPWRMLKDILEFGKTAFNKDFYYEMKALFKKYQWNIIKDSCYRWKKLYNNWIQSQL